MTWLDLLALVLASNAIIDAWLNGSLFATWRAIAQAHSDGSQGRWRDKPWELISCYFCLSYHVPIWLLVVWGLWSWLLPGWPNLVVGLIYSLAVARISLFLNAWSPASLRYQREAQLPGVIRDVDRPGPPE